jgi:hypothetical protein
LQQLANGLEFVRVLCRDKFDEQRLHLIFTASSDLSEGREHYQCNGNAQCPTHGHLLDQDGG